MALKLFEYAIIQQPTKNKDGKVTDDGRLLVGVKTILAKDETHVQMIAAREVPEDAMDDLDRLEVVVRPFERRKTLGVATLTGAQGPSGQSGIDGLDGASGPRGAAGPVGLTAFNFVPSPSAATYTPMTSITTGSSTGGVTIQDTSTAGLWVPKNE